MKYWVCLFSFTLPFFFSALLFARPVTLDDASFLVDFHDTITVKKDYSYDYHSKNCRTLLNDSDDAIAQGTIKYSVDLVVATLKSLVAWVERDDKIISVLPSSIHRGIATSSLSGFSDVEEYTITFPEVSKGARLCYEVSETRTAHLPGYFEYICYSPYAFIAKNSSCTVQSEIPLEQLVYNDHSYLSIAKKKIAEGVHFEVTAKRDYAEGWKFEKLTTNSRKYSLLLLRSHRDYNRPPLLPYAINLRNF